ncbi:MAG: succinylglutamate desuccinylase [Deltaproteobacteria bacterium]|nr:succinylglutamate desuccinylase [Deltaproteobacteria bacterium]
MRSKLMVGLILAVVAVMLIAPGAMAQKLLCVSKQDLKGEETVASCLAKGERFAIVDPYGIVRILTPEEIELTKAFNPKAFETRAFGMRYQKLAPKIAPMPVPAEVQ